MFFTWIFRKPTQRQQQVFDDVSPEIEFMFPKATAWTSVHNNELMFNCGHSEFPEPHRQVCYPPDEEKLYGLCDELNFKFKDINFTVGCEDIGVAVPMFIIATW